MGEHLAGAILAAGAGERLRSAAAGLPKPVVEIEGETLLARQARAVIEAGAGPVSAVINSETAKLIVERQIKLPSELELIVRDTPNSMETLFALEDRLRKNRALVATVDAILPRAELARFVARAMAVLDSGIDGALAVVKWRGDRRALFAEIGQQGQITSLGSRETSLVTAGIYLFSPAIFRYVRQGRDAGLGALRDYLAMLVRNGIQLAAVEIDRAIDVDNAADLAAARAAIAEEAKRSGSARDQ